MGVKIGEDILSIPLFADVVVLLIETWEDMQKLLEEVGKFSEDMKMKCGLDNCKVMTINEKEEGENKNKQQIVGKDKESVDTYKYL